MTTASLAGRASSAVARGALAAALALSAPAALADGIGRLEDFVRGHDRGSAAFEQEIFDEDGELLARSAGELWFARPDRFRVEYSDPEPIRLVSDGEDFWYYDPALDQALVRKFDEIRGDQALVLLTGDRAHREFILTSPPARDDGLSWVHATPIDKDSQIRDVWIAFDRADGGLSQMEIRDAFSHTTVLRFTSVGTDADEEAFVPDFPPGTAIVRSGE